MARIDMMATERWRVLRWHDGRCISDDLFDSETEALEAFACSHPTAPDGLTQLQRREAGKNRFVTKDERPMGGRR